LINAAGAWGDEIAALAGIAPIGLTPMRRSVARLAAPGGHDPSTWPMLFGPGERWYAKADAGALIVSLAEETPSAPMDAWPHDLDLAEALARYQDYVTEEVTRPLSSWAGLRTFAPDRNLVLGAAPQEESFIWAVGQGGYGFFTAPAASQLVADTALGRRSQLDAETVAQLSPARFVT
jgi:glycine/D-amino acid oxidase-like deaminating enzyme